MSSLKLYFIASLFALGSVAASSSEHKQLQCISGPGISHIVCTPALGDPICATYKDGTTKTFQNTCYACSDKADINYYKDGACPVVAATPKEQQLQCISGPGVSHFACTPALGDPICATYKDGTTKTFQNTCYACSDKADISYYKDGACPVVAATPKKQQLQCISGPGVSHFACTPALGDPICATYKDSTTKTFQNTCYACSDKADISYYTEGACPVVATTPKKQQLQCISGPGVSHFACTPALGDPICATYKDGTTKTFQNTCYACTDKASISYYTDGACPSSSHPSRVYCTDKQRGLFCSQLYSPVCATFKSGGGCRAAAAKTQTVSNACTACSNAKVDSYVSGKC